MEKRESATFVCSVSFVKRKKSCRTIQNMEIEVVEIDWRFIDGCPYLF